MANKALILIDLQNDFCPGGNLAVPDGDAVIPLANKLQRHFDLTVATKDWHPKDHMSFAANHPQKEVGELVTVNNLTQVLWPIHCVQNSSGAEFHPQLNVERINKIVHKGSDKHIDSYSAFFDNAHQRATGLEDYLRGQAVEDVYLMGLATDYCVKYSAMDAAELGFNVYVIADACRGVELKPGDIEKAFVDMRKAGARMVKVQDIIAYSS